MKSKSLALAALLVAACSSAYAESFVLTCSAMVVGPGETAKSLVRFDWDGVTLTTTNENLNDKLEKRQDKALLWRRIELEPKRPGEVLYSFLTMMHPTKQYKYYTSLHFIPSGTAGSLSQVLATTDKDGFLITSTQVEYEQCEFEAQ